MHESSESITYHFFYNTPEHFQYGLTMDADTWRIRDPQDRPEPPAWTELNHHRCAHCTLDDRPNCPLALQLNDFLHRFPKTDPGLKTVVRVVTNARIYEKRLSLDEGIRSLLGLIFASSDCPHLQFFKPMARFHLPFSTHEENLFRVFATFALYNVLSDKTGLIFKISDLKTIYNNLQTINHAMCERLQSIGDESSAEKAVLLLDALSKSMIESIESSFEEFKTYFTASESEAIRIS